MTPKGHREIRRFPVGCTVRVKSHGGLVKYQTYLIFCRHTKPNPESITLTDSVNNATDPLKNLSNRQAPVQYPHKNGVKYNVNNKFKYL